MGINYRQLRQQYRKCPTMPIPWLIIGICTIIALLLVNGCAWAYETIDINRLADAIYMAEGGAKTNHPYGILAHYKHTTPRTACINTIKHAMRDFTGNPGDLNGFIDFLGNRYCKVGSNTDNGTCQYWPTNVRSIYGKMQSKEL